MLLSTSILFAAMSKEELTPAFLKKNIKIFDIRTAGEWYQLGVVKNSITLTFFDEQYKYDVRKFISSLYQHIKKGETFALVCATGSRTNMVASFLGENGFNVIDLVGGVVQGEKNGVKLVRFK